MTGPVDLDPDDWEAFRAESHRALDGMIDFLRDLRRHIRNPMVLVWDRSLTHRARGMAKFLDSATGYHPVLLPPYAPELNPVE